MAPQVENIHLQILISLSLYKLVTSFPGSALSACSLEYNQPINKTTGLYGDQFKSNLQLLSNDLIFASTAKSFYMTTTGSAPNKSYGFFLCRGDVTSSNLCHSCVANLTQWAFSFGDINCTERVAYADYCMFHYANYSFFGKVDTTSFIGATLLSPLDDKASQAYNRTLEGVVERAVWLAAYNSTDLFATWEGDVVDEHERVYALAQCTPDIGRSGCGGCLKIARSYMKIDLARQKFGWVVLGSCQLRYDNVSFFVSPARPGSQPPVLAFLLVMALLSVNWVN